MFRRLHITHGTLYDIMLKVWRTMRRYGGSTRKMASNINLFLEISKQHGVTPTFPITAEVLHRHQDIGRRFSSSGVEFAIHGYRHIDHTQLSDEERSAEIENAIRVFRENNVVFSGFRFPYLRWDKKYIELLGKYDFSYDSSNAVVWDAVPKGRTNKRRYSKYESMLDQYEYKRADKCMALPEFKNEIVEIPVSLPDDDLLIDRLDVRDGEVLTSVWSDILDQTYARGELFTLQLHPERIRLCQDALWRLMRRARAYRPSVWIAELAEINRWWRERRDVRLRRSKIDGSGYEVRIEGSERCSVLVKGADVDCPVEEFVGGYAIVKARCFRIHSRLAPIVGVPRGTPRKYVDFLEGEGFEVQVGGEKQSCGIYLETDREFSEEKKKRLLDTIEHTPGPLIRVWRWPTGARSALSVTGDIDAMTSFDFLRRAFYK